MTQADWDAHIVTLVIHPHAAQPQDVAGLLYLVQRASDPVVPEWSAYAGYVVGNAAWYAKHCAHQARVLGLLADVRHQAETEAA